MPQPSRIRLLVVVQPPDGGVARHVVDLLSFLGPDEWDVELFCPADSIVWAAAAAQPNVRLTAISRRRAPSLSDVATTWRLLGALGRAEVVHAHSSKAGFQVRLLAALRRRGGQVVFTPHGWSFWAVRGWKSKACVALERLCARATHTVLCVAAWEREAGLREKVGRRSQYTVVPNGIDVGRFTAAPAPVPGRLVMVARLAAPARRPELLVAALPRLRARHPAAHVVFVGDGPLAGALRSQAASLGVGDAMTILGERSDVPEQLRSAAVAVHACGYDACSLAVLEAMAAGRPVVASRIGGMDEIVAEGVTGELARHDPEEWAETVGALLDDPVAAEAMGRAGRERATGRYARDRMAAEVLDLYRTVAAQPSGRMGR